MPATGLLSVDLNRNVLEEKLAITKVRNTASRKTGISLAIHIRFAVPKVATLV